MRTLPRPTLSPGIVFARCISQIRPLALRRRLTGVSGTIAAESADYDSWASVERLHLFPRANSIIGTHGTVLAANMTRVYEEGMVKSGAPGRRYYNRLRVGPGKCPLCGVGSIESLDHHLPKSRYCIFAVTPVNLVPCCDRCQKSKGQKYPKSKSGQTLHPYYDNYGTSTWLKASVVHSAPASFRFRAAPPASWSSTRKGRVRRHMKVLKLKTLFGVNAADELVHIRGELIDRFNDGGAAKVREELERRARSSRRAFRNSWQTAMYQAAAASNWFCNGGFRHE